MTEKPRRLGRGLEALLATNSQKAPDTPPTPRGAEQRLPIAEIRPNPYQPRKDFSPEDLAELESSLRTSGLLQPITVRAASAGGYELVAGERRLRAAARIGWTEIPVLVKELDDRAMLTLALVENLQRADLNPIEEAEGYRRLLDDFGLTQQMVAEAVGKDRTTVANFLRLLNLPEGVRKMVRGGQLTLGHARALLALPDERRMMELATEIVARKLSVRDVERRVRPPESPNTVATATSRREAGSRSGAQDAEVRRIRDVLRKHLQTDVSISVSAGNRGEIRIAFYSPDDLERVLELLLGARSDLAD